MLGHAVCHVAAVALVDGEVAAKRECMIAKAIDGLVVALIWFVVMEVPVRASMGQLAIGVAGDARLEADDRALLAHGLPFRNG